MQRLQKVEVVMSIAALILILASAVWGWFRFEPVGGGTKIKVVLLICPDRLRW